jgi:serine phosphatase RsbU (regulator of sigma subunit)/ligand-binding sensor domain-containing protein
VKKKFLSVCIFIFLAIVGFAQDGNYYITNFPSSTYSASSQNWSIAQDSLKRIFVANQSGILMYDGETWITIPLLDGKNATSVASSTDKKTIYAGGNGEFGYISFLHSGEPKYISLNKPLPDKEKATGPVWSIQSINQNTFFCCNDKILWFTDTTFKRSFSPSGEKFHTFFTIESTIVVREAGIGMDYFKNGKLEHIPNTTELANVKVRAIIPRTNHIYWLCTDKGLYQLLFDINHPDWSLCTKQSSPVNAWMSESNIYCGLAVNSGLFALGSLNSGVLLVDSAFNIVNHINYEMNGLQDNCINFIYKDFSGNLWLALNNGLSYVEINTPITSWSKSNGIIGSIQSIAKYNNTLYLATDKGIEMLNAKTNTFQPTEIQEESWDVCNTGSDLLVGTTYGLYILNTKGSKKILSNNGVHKIFIDKKHNNTMLLIGVDTLMEGVIKNGLFELTRGYSAPDISSIAESNNGDLYFGTINAAAIIYQLKESAPGKLTQTNKTFKNSAEINLFNYQTQVLAATDTGIFSLNNEKFSRSPLFNAINSATEIKKGIQYGGDIWLAVGALNKENVREEEVTVLRKTNKEFVEDHKLLKHIRGVTSNCFFIDSNKMFIGTNDGLIEYNTNIKNINNSFNTFISKITHKNDTDIICHNVSPSINTSDTSFSFRNNELHFFASASDYYDKSQLEFSWYLQGEENNYGNWTKDNKIHYNNLHEGSYTLHLKSRDIFGIEGAPVTYSFIILPPWYRTIWAYILYVVALIASVIFIVRYNTKRLMEQNIKLEKVITERTKTIAEQKAEIEIKNQDITNSINYAKLIQEAILPPVQDISKIWDNFFLFFQPKDIVSGDFYWFNKINDKEMLIGCADCTGHGVPGGFMSMICSDKLSDAAKKAATPDEILFHVNNAVKTTLRQTGDELVNKDGMEMVLIKIDFLNKKVWYSGANRPVWIVKKDSNELLETKPSKSGIASFTAVDYKYEGHEFQLSAGDTVYMSTDGYADQFGGPEGKKFMTKNFKKFLTDISTKPIKEQGSLVKEHINNWMKGYEQVDDLLVIGIQL